MTLMLSVSGSIDQVRPLLTLTSDFSYLKASNNLLHQIEPPLKLLQTITQTFIYTDGLK